MRRHLLCMKQTRLEEMDHFASTLERQIQIADETLDPGLENYRRMQADQAKQRREVAAKVDTLKENGSKAADDFRPTEEALRAMGVAFVSPVIESEELNVERRRHNLAGRHNLLTQGQHAVQQTNAQLAQHADHLRVARTEQNPEQVQQIIGKPPPPTFKRLEEPNIPGGTPRPPSPLSASFR
eukprot:TRINITY_DN5708_c0_g1_i2.p1 TRINITY_DN5708_c0_g1~~TRINITY_DN5708_c0_g1_i2.p1  ORF type:complete len:183 (-),score=43.43 TRINITY_DN5708_c0_g1_i2:112-660(-)